MVLHFPFQLFRFPFGFSNAGDQPPGGKSTGVFVSIYSPCFFLPIWAVATLFYLVTPILLKWPGLLAFTGKHDPFFVWGLREVKAFH